MIAQGSTPTSVSFTLQAPDIFIFSTNTIRPFTITGQTKAWFMLGYITPFYDITKDINLAINTRKANL